MMISEKKIAVVIKYNLGSAKSNQDLRKGELNLENSFFIGSMR